MTDRQNDNNHALKCFIEAALMAADEPLTQERLHLLIDEAERPPVTEIKAVLAELKQDYINRGIFLKEVASGFRFQIKPEYGPNVGRLWEEKPPKMSRAYLETLALVAYRQPITRGEIEEIRGVSVSSHIVKSLIEREWVRVVGYREVPGRPALLATTNTFLDYFGLESLNELPPLSEIKDLDQLSLSLPKDFIDDLQKKGPAKATPSEEVEKEGADQNSKAVVLEVAGQEMAFATLDDDARAREKTQKSTEVVVGLDDESECTTRKITELELESSE